MFFGVSGLPNPSESPEPTAAGGELDIVHGTGRNGAARDSESWLNNGEQSRTDRGPSSGERPRKLAAVVGPGIPGYSAGSGAERKARAVEQFPGDCQNRKELALLGAEAGEDNRQRRRGPRQPLPTVGRRLRQGGTRRRRRQVEQSHSNIPGGRQLRQAIRNPRNGTGTVRQTGRGRCRRQKTNSRRRQG